MSITANSGSGVQRELIPAGSHVARCYEMLHIGTVKEQYMGEPKEINKVRISFELPNEMRVFNEENGEQPMVVSKEYTLSMHEKANLRKDLENWRSQRFTENEADNFDITKLLGIPCMLSVVHTVSKTNGKTYANIGGISGLPKGIQCPAQINPTVEFNYEDKFDVTFIEGLPSFIKDKIKSSDEYSNRMLQLEMAEETKRKAAALDISMNTTTPNDNTTGQQQAPYKVAENDPGVDVSNDLPF